MSHPSDKDRAPWQDEGARGWQPSKMVKPRPPARPADPGSEAAPQPEPATPPTEEDQ
jgi:hypothetical protein